MRSSSSTSPTTSLSSTAGGSWSTAALRSCRRAVSICSSTSAFSDRWRAPLTSPHEPFSGRVEDAPLLTGQGCYVGDITLPGLSVAAFVRSPHANADIRSVDVEAARRAPGVLTVLTGADLDAAGVGNVSRPPPQKGRGGPNLVMP